MSTSTLLTQVFVFYKQERETRVSSFTVVLCKFDLLSLMDLGMLYLILSRLLCHYLLNTANRY